MDKNVFEVPKNPTIVASDSGIILKTQAPTLLNKTSMLKGDENTDTSVFTLLSR